MKKIILTLLPALLAVMATGCSSEETPDRLPDNPENPVQEEVEIKAPLAPDNELTTFIHAKKATTVELFKTLISEADNTENVVFSPHNIYTLVSMLANGVGEENLEDILSFLNIKSDWGIKGINRNNSLLLDNVAYLDPTVTFKMANSVWTDTDFDIRPEFTNIMKETYKSPTFTHDFMAEDVCSLINSWVSENTDNLIPQLLTQQVTGPLALTNAMYFKGSWSEPFDPGQTTKEIFTCSDGSTVSVDMMHHPNVIANLGEVYGGYALSLPFGNGRYYISFVLPAPGSDIKSIAAELNVNKLRLWEVVSRKGETEVFLPKINVETKYDLKEIMTALE